MNVGNPLSDVLSSTFAALEQGQKALRSDFRIEEVGVVTHVGHGVARIRGLPGVRSGELVQLKTGHFSNGGTFHSRAPAARPQKDSHCARNEPGKARAGRQRPSLSPLIGMAFNLDPDEVGIILLDHAEKITAGCEARRTGRVLDVPVGAGLLGRVIDGVGRPLDQRGPVRCGHRLPVERPAPPIMDRAPVTVPLQTGIKVVDALIPIGRGQRELILGDRQTGKTALAVDTILNQHDKGVLCIYCAIGQRASAVSKLLAELRAQKALEYCVVMLATEDSPPALQFITPYAAMSVGEHFMAEGQDVLVVLDDLTRHARAYRELSLLLHRPPGREAFPGDIFYVHSRLLERSTHLRSSSQGKGGSLTTLAIAETEGQNLAAYIPTNLISITDGQIYFSPDLFSKGILPAVEVGRSVSRVGGKTQLPAYRAISGALRLAYAQFEELEGFARFGTRLDPSTRKLLERGQRVREVLKQPTLEPMTAPEQIAVLLAVTEGVLDAVPIEEIRTAQQRICAAVVKHLPEVCERIETGKPFPEEDRQAVVRVAREALS